MQVLDKTAETWVGYPAKRLLTEAGVSNMTKEQILAFFEQMKLAMGGASYRQPSGDIESQGTNRYRQSPIFIGRLGLTPITSSRNSNLQPFKTLVVDCHHPPFHQYLHMQTCRLQHLLLIIGPLHTRTQELHSSYLHWLILMFQNQDLGQE